MGSVSLGFAHFIYFQSQTRHDFRPPLYIEHNCSNSATTRSPTLLPQIKQSLTNHIQGSSIDMYLLIPQVVAHAFACKLNVFFFFFFQVSSSIHSGLLTHYITHLEFTNFSNKKYNSSHNHNTVQGKNQEIGRVSLLYIDD